MQASSTPLATASAAWITAAAPLAEAAPTLHVRPRTPNVATAISSQCRPAFANCYFDEEECSDGIAALDAYRWTWSESQQVFTDAPFHDWASHGADAWRYLSLSWRETRPMGASASPWSGIVQLGEPQTMRTGFGKLTDAHLAKRRRFREERAMV